MARSVSIANTKKNRISSLNKTSIKKPVVVKSAKKSTVKSSQNSKNVVKSLKLNQAIAKELKNTKSNTSSTSSVPSVFSRLDSSNIYKVIFSNLAQSVTLIDIENLCKPIGKFSNPTLAKAGNRLEASVTFPTRELANECLRKYSNLSLDGENLVLRIETTKANSKPSILNKLKAAPKKQPVPTTTTTTTTNEPKIKKPFQNNNNNIKKPLPSKQIQSKNINKPTNTNNNNNKRNNNNVNKKSTRKVISVRR